ncbi:MULTISPECIES: Na(+)-translocating NADH-quinone reductase subunit C [unclassified Motilimonas]|uniref:Na(+)-translocating NADH-quinone reductase subunit C n=1 Tax=Motilimonas TaxID=1914248 RepID=UPI001E32875F|nr:MULTISPECIES: Na(+)-translocating NADH-quinone reductase subunit C [unclassified Motilimonas]MCE0556012.1 Na(+)-translocating NADH-quinone reductase subunit C [Motilimonas sp. E26]MDO6526465.1 Na(+)-translocating NADH-quinone reductase subunit C [Motilimonas sp. 1_MG-2023]
MASKESLGKTLGVVVGVCLVCSIVVSVAAVGLRPTQQANALLDKQKNILAVSGLEIGSQKMADVFAKNIEPRLVDLKTGEYVDVKDVEGVSDINEYDPLKAAKEPEKSTKLSPEQAIAGFSTRENIGLVYLVNSDAGELERVIVPVRGAGLWNMMYAFVAIQPDGNTVDGITYYQQGETPGLGGEVENPMWKALWPGKKLYDEQGNPAIKIVKGGAAEGDVHGVDGLSGATLTGTGIQHTFDFWLSTDGYGSYLKKLGKGELNNG